MAVGIEDEKENKELFLFDSKEIDTKLPLFLKMTEKDNKSFASCYTYTYFTSVGILAVIWFIVLVVDTIVYTKTTTCNDLNKEHRIFTCYDVDNNYTIVDCNPDEELRPDIRVFCYLYKINARAIGIAFGNATFMIYLVTLYFKIAVYVAQKKCKCCCGGRTCNCWILVIVIQIVAAVVGTAVAVLLLPLHLVWDQEIYFFYGLAVMRVAMYPLAIITGAVVIPVPWCFFTKKVHYTTKVHQTSQEEANVVVVMKNRQVLSTNSTSEPGTHYTLIADSV